MKPTDDLTSFPRAVLNSGKETHDVWFLVCMLFYERFQNHLKIVPPSLGIHKEFSRRKKVGISSVSCIII
jgi:hypothetical protein